VAEKARYVDLYKQLQAYARLYTFRDPNVACLFGLRVNECYVLDYIANHGPMTVSEIANVLGIHKSNASRIIMSLQAGNLVAFKNNDQDARQKLVHVSDAGVEKHEEVQSYFVARLEKALRQFTSKDVKTATQFLAALTDDAASRILEVSSQSAPDGSK